MKKKSVSLDVSSLHAFIILSYKNLSLLHLCSIYRFNWSLMKCDNPTFLCSPVQLNWTVTYLKGKRVFIFKGVLLLLPKYVANMNSFRGFKTYIIGGILSLAGPVQRGGTVLQPSHNSDSLKLIFFCSTPMCRRYRFDCHGWTSKVHRKRPTRPSEMLQ